MGAEAMQVVGASLKAGGINSEAQAKAQAAKHNAYIDMVNADQATQQAAEEARVNDVQASQHIGQARANYGASGVSSTEGSALDVLQQSARNAELDSLQIRHAGEMKAWGYKEGASMESASAENAHTAGNFGVANALWSSMNQGVQASGAGAGAGAG